MPSPTPWQPVLASAALRAGGPPVATRLLGRDLALWRSADGAVQAWDDRCPHRSVRLSMGTVHGDRLVCAYHGWAWQAGSGQCVEVPALPHQPVPGHMRVGVRPVQEQGGLVWVAADDVAGPLTMASHASDGPWQWLRSVGVRVPAARLGGWLADQGFAAEPEGAWQGVLDGLRLRLHLQPCDEHLSLVHAGCADAATSDQALAALNGLHALRDRAEAAEGSPA